MRTSRSRVTTRKHASFKTGIILLVMLIVAVFLTLGVQNSGIVSGLANLMNPDFYNFQNLEQLTDQEAAEAQKQLAGFWTYTMGDSASSPVAKREYVWVRANGWMWHVTVWHVNAPNGDRHRIKRVLNGYHKPYSYSLDNETFLSQARVLRQAYIIGADTCYGASNYDEMWLIGVSKDGNTLRYNNRDYAKYTGEAAAFFPEGTVLEIVDDLFLRGCDDVEEPRHIARRLLAGSLNAIPRAAAEQTVNELIRDYYKPIILDELMRQYDPRGVPDTMSLRLTLSPEGAVTNLRHRSAALVTKRFDDLAIADIRTWRFPALTDSNEALRMDIVVRVK